MVMLSETNGTPLSHDVQQLHQLLQIEIEQKERALARVVMLEEEIRALKLILATQPTTQSTTQSIVPSTTAPTTDNTITAFNGELILVVDDQSLNLDLIEALLDDCNLTIVCKSSALEALEFIKTRMPDLILMDIQMPVMDGYAATAKIRADYAEHGPIILAMTANNSQEDEQKSLAAGMQGHLCKPIDADLLIKQLEFWLAHTTADQLTAPPAHAASNAPSPRAEQTQLDELPGIDLAAALVRLRGNRSLLEEVLVSFADKAALIIPELQQAVVQQDYGGATRILHRLKGTSANLSAVNVAPLASRLESQCKNGQLPNKQEIAELAAAIAQLITTAQGLTTPTTPSAQAQVSVDQAEIKHCLARINAHLNTDLGQAEEAVEALLQLCHNTPWADAAQQLRNVFYQFNLRAVHELIVNGFE